MKTDRRSFLLPLLLVLVSASGAVSAQASPPAWEQLTPAQREALVAPVRDRWNSAPPEQRQRMLRHGERWQAMTPEQREQARTGMRRFDGMSAEQREQARALFAKMRGMTPEQRGELRKQWGSMNSEQRRQWIRDNPPPQRDRD
ncbi:DUF3106 domain-containing protein [Stenotrophomonas tumulicola]|uniref:DUF3106 domain-containing protein n=1 Tax=Stenotrophomonas tumulicola TaxID=1685415 RepID=A0A7W3FNS0_9GAMM|nr:DUF3106 domain-containing protein [Stenotrophomonas tumulicola]MBA8682915.1 DUF3106 domain-containing protein [Stenotrophomonas tumulicola]